MRRVIIVCKLQDRWADCRYMYLIRRYLYLYLQLALESCPAPTNRQRWQRERARRIVAHSAKMSKHNRHASKKMQADREVVWETERRIACARGRGRGRNWGNCGTFIEGVQKRNLSVLYSNEVAGELSKLSCRYMCMCMCMAQCAICATHTHTNSYSVAPIECKWSNSVSCVIKCVSCVLCLSCVATTKQCGKCNI